MEKFESLEKMPEIEIVHSPEAELAEVFSLIERNKKKPYAEQKYEVKLPGGLNFEQLEKMSENDISEIIQKEFSERQQDKIEGVKTEIERVWLEVATGLKRLFDETGLQMPERYQIIFTGYGPGRQYSPLKKAIIMDIFKISKEHLAVVVTHEAIHIAINDLLNKYGIYGEKHWLKEHIADLLTREARADSWMQNRLPPEETERVNKIFDQYYPNIEKILQEISELSTNY